MATTKKRVTLNLTQEDLRLLDLMHESSGEKINALVKKALFYYYINFLKEPK